MRSQPTLLAIGLSGVHFTLCGGTIAKLGTAYHHNKYLPGIDDLSLPGCFGMVRVGACLAAQARCIRQADVRADPWRVAGY